MRRALASAGLCLFLVAVLTVASDEPRRDEPATDPARPAARNDASSTNPIPASGPTADGPATKRGAPTAEASTPGSNDRRAELSDLVQDDDREAEARLRRLLLQPVKVEFEDIPLRDAIESIAKQAGIENPLRNKAALKEDIGDLEERITLLLGETTAANALHWLLKPDELWFSVRRGVFSITSKSKAHETMFVRTWDVRPLVDIMLKRGWPETDSDYATPWRGAGFFQFGGDGPHVPYSLAPGGEHAESPRARALRRLADIVRFGTLGKDVYANEGFPLGFVEFVDTTLVVRTSEPVHEKVDALLAALEAVATKSGSSTIEALPWREPVVENQRIRRRLRETVADWDAPEMPLGDFLKLVRTKTGCPVVLDEKSLKYDKLDKDHPVSFVGKKVSAETALAAALDHRILRFEVTTGALHVSTDTGMEENRTVVVHDLSAISEAVTTIDDLSRTIDQTAPQWRQDNRESRIAPWNGALVTTGSASFQADVARILHDVRANATRRRASEPADPKAEDDRRYLRVYVPHERGLAPVLKTTIESRVAPDTWEAAKGSGSIEVIGDLLVVRQTSAVHRQVGRFLDTLRDADVRLRKPEKPASPR